MKSKFINYTLFSVLAALALSSYNASAASYRVDWVYGGHTTTGYFTGTENGNVIFDTSVSSLLIDNVAIQPLGGSWYSSSHNATTGLWETTNGQVSFDGEENNFLFVDGDFPANFSHRTEFFSLTTTPLSLRQGGSYTSTYTSSYSPALEIIEYNQNYNNSADVTGWSITRVGQVPEPGVVLLIVLGLASLRCFRTRVI